MSKLKLIATSAFGIESLVAWELKALGYTEIETKNGKVEFTGDETDIARCNIHLRIADRVVIKMGEFKATDFEELYQGVLAIKWEEFIPENGKMHVVGKSIKSKLFSVPDCQSITKKAVVESMKRKYPNSWFDEDGPVYKIEIALLRDIATVTIDTSGAGLHKRGYRIEGVEAPLRETLAAAILQISRWDSSRILADPFCGSGTIPIEAAMIARNIPPGLNREFSAESWPSIPKKIWQNVRQEAEKNINSDPITIYASDIDKRAIKVAKENAARMGLEEDIVFQKKPIEEFSSNKKYGCIVTNPPYGERIGEKQEVERIYKVTGEVFSLLPEWSMFILSSNENFEKSLGSKSDKNRKLYNGKIKCYLYQYLGPLPKSDFKSKK